jgi:beta-glucosidase
MSGEGHDRTTTKLSSIEEALIQTVAKVQRNSVVNLHSTGAVDTSSWLDVVSTLIAGWCPGQADGAAFAALLFGDDVPGGRLPVTFANRLPFQHLPQQYPGVNNEAEYSEGLFVGYRWFFKFAPQAVQFPFGYGMNIGDAHASYINFDTRVTAQSVAVTFDVVNNNAVTVIEVPQLYVDLACADEPPRQLRDFYRIKLAPGQAHHVSLSLTPHDLSAYSLSAGWFVCHGTTTLYVARSAPPSDSASSIDYKHTLIIAK